VYVLIGILHTRVSCYHVSDIFYIPFSLLLVMYRYAYGGHPWLQECHASYFVHVSFFSKHFLLHLSTYSLT